MRRSWGSLRDFSWGLLKRWYFLLPAFALDPFDLLERFTLYEWNPPLWLMWSIFGLSLLIAAWLTYRDIWEDPDSNRLAILLVLRREGERMVQLFELTLQLASESDSGLQNEDIAVAALRTGQIKPWMARAMNDMTESEQQLFFGDENSGSVLDIDVDLFTDLAGLGRYLNERVKRLADICEGIKYG